MKQIIRITGILVVAMTITVVSMAQQGLQLNVNYSTAVPLGSAFRDYIDKTSFNGIQGSVLYGITDHFKVGLQSSYNDFYQKYGRSVYKASDGSDISTVLSNSLQSAPLMAKGEYAFRHMGLFRPYVGLGAGINFINYDQYLGEFEYNQSYTKPAFTGDAGLLIALKRNGNTGFRISTSYNLMPFKEQGIKNLDTWNVQGGISVPLNK